MKSVSFFYTSPTDTKFLVPKDPKQAAISGSRCFVIPLIYGVRFRLEKEAKTREREKPRGEENEKKCYARTGIQREGRNGGEVKRIETKKRRNRKKIKTREVELERREKRKSKMKKSIRKIDLIFRQRELCNSYRESESIRTMRMFR